MPLAAADPYAQSVHSAAARSATAGLVAARPEGLGGYVAWSSSLKHIFCIDKSEGSRAAGAPDCNI